MIPMQRTWRLASKATLGDMYHLDYAGFSAACSPHITLLEQHARKTPHADGPDGERCCQRCQKIAAHWNAAAAERV